MVNWRWLRPGLHLKRWVLIICAGMILVILGAISLALGIFNPQTTGTDSIFFDPYAFAGILIAAGSILTFTGVYRLVRRIEKLLKRSDEDRNLTEIAYQHNKLEQGPRFVCFGGGHGLSTLLSGLRTYSRQITAIVSVADDGGSSGRLRLDFEMLPPGDIRNCLTALADAGPVMAELMQYRFTEGEFTGHSFGNLFLMVLAKIRGNFGLAVMEANRILSVRGQVLPATLDKVNLVATHPDGSKTTGQKHIARSEKKITELSLKPQPGDVQPDVLEAVALADIIVIGPGSLYTSVLPNLLGAEIVEAINQAKAKVAFVINTMGQPGETAHFSASEHIKTLLRHAPGLRLDIVIINSYRPSPQCLGAYAEKGIGLTEYDRKEVAELGMRVLLRDVIDMKDPSRHDHEKLAAVILEAATQSF